MASRVVAWVIVFAVGLAGAVASEASEVAPLPEPARVRQFSVAQRRAALAAVGAIVPDEKGRFPAKPAKDADKLDWRAALATSSDPAAPEILADLAVMAQLAASKQQAAAQVLLQMGFDPETMIYRDQIGRELRGMAPYSLVGLIAGTRAANADMARYASYQLERLDRQDPKKAIAAAAIDPTLRASVIRALGTSGNRDAVPVIWELTNSNDPMVREAARDAWLAYVAGPPPPPAPKQFLKLPGGKLSKQKQPLWLTYRELATIELHRAIQETFAEETPSKASPEALTQRLFAHFDAARTARLQGEVEALLAKAAAPGGALQVAAQLEALLGQDSGLQAPPELAAIYAETAQGQMEAEKWSQAATYFAKAAAYARDASKATRYQAAHHVALGKELEAGGTSGELEYEVAMKLDPSFAPAKRAYAKATGGPNLAMLIVGIGVLGIGLIVFFLGWRARK